MGMKPITEFLKYIYIWEGTFGLQFFSGSEDDCEAFTSDYSRMLTINPCLRSGEQLLEVPYASAMRIVSPIQ